VTSAFGLTTISGLPAHVLIVHFAVVLVPLAAVCLVASLKPSVSRRFGIWLPVLGVGALLSVFAAMNAGGWLQNHVQNTALVRHHVAIAGQLWPFSAGVALLSIAVWLLHGKGAGSSPAESAEPAESAKSAASSKTYLLVGVLSVAVAAASVVEVYRIGEAGARAAWTGHVSQTATAHH
jgi:hypothetical protein